MKKKWLTNANVMTNSASKSVVERLLTLRGIVKPEEIKEFLNPLETKLTHPNCFLDIPKAVERIAKAIDNEENILVYGDFDADGVTSTALLIRTFKHLGAKIDYFIPEREKEGHGLNVKALVKLMTTKKPKVIITVDCGVSDVEQVDFINSFKIDVIITDHHEAPETLPNALAIINPKAQNALSEKLTAKEIEHLTSLAGVGVSFKLAQALLEHYKKLDFIYDILPYVTVGTVSDVVPLIGENRYFVAKGLELISKGKHYGIGRILESAGYNLENGITSEHIAFGIAPRINASGRLETVEDALKVLISDNHQEIEMAIMSLENFNKIRQTLCANVFAEAEEMLLNEGNDDNAIVLFSPKWHLGVIGIVASKLVEKYYKPTFLMTYSEETKQIRCSARSVDGIHLYEVISANSELLDGFGGHAMAAGLAFDTQKVAFEEVKKALNKTVDEALGGKELEPIMKIDMELQPEDLDSNLIADIERLQPFGAANPNPVFVMRELTLSQKKLIGSERNHLKLFLEDYRHNSHECLWWSRGDIPLITGDKLDVAFYPQLNTFNGSTTIQLIIQDAHSEKLDAAEEETKKIQKPKTDVKIYDHRKKTDIISSVNDYVKTSSLSVSIFAEDKSVIERLKPYTVLSEKIRNRNNLEKADVLMFFDYPAGPELLDEVLNKTSAKFLHFMHYEVKKTDEKEFLKTFSGMIKFAHNNRNGIFDLEKSAAFLAISKDAIISVLELFENSGMIKISDKNEAEYKVEFLENIEISKTLHNTGYKDFVEIIRDIEDYKNSLLDEELSNII